MTEEFDVLELTEMTVESMYTEIRIAISAPWPHFRS